jgi:uncharacterized protein (TIGR02231 family)
MSRILTVILLLLPLASWAAPVQVTLFPSSAQVEERSPLTASPPEGGFTAARLVLPGQADPATLRFGRLPDGIAVADVSWASRTENDQAALAPLTARLEALKEQRDAVTAELEGVRGRLAFWKGQTTAAQQSVAALRELAEEVGGTIHANTAKLQKLEQQAAKLNADIATVEEEIARVAGQRTVWDVTLLFSGAAPAELAYAYALSDCGWEPLYRLEALPAQGRVDFSWQAKVWQRSGQDWTGVRLHLATMPPQSQAQPADLPPWEIAPVQIHAKALAAPAMMAMRAETADEAAPAPLSQPQETRYSTYAAWDMGKRALPAGATRVFEIERTAWQAEFVHLLRPSLDTKAFIQATTRFDQPRELPQGRAFFLIDGATVDQRDFALSGREATLFFGTDPMLTCETSLKDKKTGDKGLFKQKQIFVREWTMTVRNASKAQARFRLEEPRPQLRDERITLEVSATPAPLAEETPEVMAWNGTVAPGGEQAVALKIQFEAPEDLHIDPGWRW